MRTAWDEAAAVDALAESGLVTKEQLLEAYTTHEAIKQRLYDIAKQWYAGILERRKPTTD